MEVPLWASVPFALMLLSIALFPLINLHWWEKNYPLVAIALGILGLSLYLFLSRDLETVWHTALEYFSFISLIGSLFVVTGGILIRIEGPATPWVNALILFLGAAISNVIGTTGASMLLIRPFLRLNKGRLKPYLVIFFIFIVSNIGGALTPIGDPPLFLGYLKGIPFFWLVEHVWFIWLFTLALVLGVFLFFDFRNRKGLDEPAFAGKPGLFFLGKRSLIFLGLIIIAVFLPTPIRELIMIASALASYFLTPRSVHIDNDFSFDPIKEVAILFLGIFATMIPALKFLETHGHSLGLTTPGQFFWITGSLSSFLDNAPTYLTFLTTAMGALGLDIHGLLAQTPKDVVAISLGAVFFGAMTYIGNGPNFMVKCISDRTGLKCPSFLGYIIRYSLPILVPVFLLVWLLFIR
ncbi:MAG: sodium:proton antiporter [Caldiserica bacterium]|jgi:Na+/H+ antiporter NhaD/arsenite permease-like protein|nr:sodium:proton antiporter [Caldisericota bacterium]MDH7562513.1 sodium:proton antiporter [Caldisericota bacterium]